jgi:cystathionine beta-lyase/cystathionine gamma-synthase
MIDNKLIFKGAVMNYDTEILHKNASKDPYTGALSIPIYSASTYHQKDVNVRQEFDYSRSGNPTRKALEDTLAGLENGERAFAFSSGMGALSSALFSVLKQGDHILAPEQLYGGTYRFLTGFINRFGVEHSFVDQRNLVATEASIKPNTRVLLLESPSNPLLHITDVAAMIALARKYNLITIIDNTFLTPYFFRPIELGIDLSVHSATKFLGGHSDLVAGAVICRTPQLSEQVGFVQNTCGDVLSPENSWLLLRGIKTLSARMKIQQENAFSVAQWLIKQDWVKAVHYPGLPTHPGHELLKSQASGFSAVLSFQCDSIARAYQIMKNVKIWSVAVSLGGVESILSYPYKMSHGAMPALEKTRLGIREDLLRLSIGLEHPNDLCADLHDAANAI